MRVLFSILILFAFLIQTLSKFVIVLNFELNRDYIAKNLCVKKDEVNNCCQGSCHLSDKLEEEDKKGQHTPFQNTIKEVELQIINQQVEFGFYDIGIKLEHFFVYKFPVTNSKSISVFRPPKAII